MGFVLPSPQRRERDDPSQRREGERRRGTVGVALCRGLTCCSVRCHRQKAAREKGVGVSEHGILAISLLPSQLSHSRPLAPPLPSTLRLCVTVHMSPKQEAGDKPTQRVFNSDGQIKKLS